MSFHIIKQLVSERFDALQKSGATLLAVDHDRDDIWNVYLNAFPEELRQEHNCNCCKAFIRQIGNVVVVTPELRLETLWGINPSEIPNKFLSSIIALHDYVLARPIKGLFYHVAEKNRPAGIVGTDQNFSEKHQTIFRHFSVSIPKSCQGDFAAKSGDLKGTFDVLKRGLNELTADAMDTVMELIAQKSLYRGSEYEHIVKGLRSMWDFYWELRPEEGKENFLWHCALTQPPAICRARNTAIGTLLIDLSEGIDLETAVRKFEAVMAPANYKRPTALVTPRMVENAKKELAELGMISALSRRRLDTRDLGPHNALYVHRPAPRTKDVFDDLTGPSTVKVAELGKVEEIGIDHFLEKVLPSAKNVRVLVENRHLPNFATLTGAVDPEAPNLFKWESSFGWSYAGGVASAIKERVKAAGGTVEGGWMRASLGWHNHDDLDLHFARKDRKHHVGYMSKKDSVLNVTLDVDMNAPHTVHTREPVENIHFAKQLPPGDYNIYVNQYTLRETANTGFELEIEVNGETLILASPKNPRENNNEAVSFKVTKEGQVIFEDSGLTKKTSSLNRWGVTTNQWRTVKAITLSPNHWGRSIGNKHHFFLLEGCVSDEQTRGFYNEFLCEKLQSHRKVTELLASKVEVLPAEGAELSGIGFTDTERNSLLVEVESAFKRVVKVLF